MDGEFKEYELDCYLMDRESEGAVTFPNQPGTKPHSDSCSPLPTLHTYLSRHFIILFSHLCLRLPHSRFISDFLFCMDFGSLPYVIHTPSIFASF